MSDLPKQITNSMGIEFVLIEPGKFIMGSDKGKDNEKPPHEVEITYPFYMSKYPITNRQYGGFSPQRQTIVLGALSRDANTPEMRKCPKISVTWDEARQFCEYAAKRDERAEMLPEGAVYRLPTEAEWEYACRAGTTTIFNHGDECTSKEANVLGGPGKLLPVDTYPLNAWGLGDFHGNAGEWVLDRYSETYYAESPTQDPQGPDSGDLRVVRGGSFSDLAEDSTSSSRTGLVPSRPYSYVGFRMVCVIR